MMALAQLILFPTIFTIFLHSQNPTVNATIRSINGFKKVGTLFQSPTRLQQQHHRSMAQNMAGHWQNAGGILSKQKTEPNPRPKEEKRRQLVVSGAPSSLSTPLHPSFMAAGILGHSLSPQHRFNSLPTANQQAIILRLKLAKHFSSTNGPIPPEFTEDQVKRYVQRTNLELEMAAYGGITDDLKTFRHIFEFDKNVPKSDDDDHRHHLLPPERIHEHNHFFNNLPTPPEEKEEAEVMEEEEEGEKIDEKMLKEMGENRAEIGEGAMRVVAGQLEKMAKIFRANRVEGLVNPDGLQRANDLDEELEKFLTGYLPTNLIRGAKERLEYFCTEQENLDREKLLIFLEKLKGRIEEGRPKWMGGLMDVLMDLEGSWNWNELMKGRRKGKVGERMVDIEMVLLHTELAEMAAKTAQIALGKSEGKKEEEEGNCLRELAKMKLYAAKVRDVHLILPNLAWAAFSAFTEDAKANVEMEDEQKWTIVREMSAQLGMLGHRHRLDQEWAEKLKDGNVAAYEAMTGRNYEGAGWLAKSEKRVLAHFVQVYLRMGSPPLEYFVRGQSAE